VTDDRSTIRCAVDMGGTFTDLAVASAGHGLRLFKQPTTPADPAQGVLGVLQLAADEDGVSLGEYLARVELLLHGTTRSTNAVLTGTTARTALICTKGHPDTLTQREGGRPDPFNFSYDYPDAYIPRALTFEVPERIGSGGEVVRPLDEDAVARILADLESSQVEAIAVCLLWSIVNPAHENRIGELIAQHLPGVAFTLSHQLNPVLREYRRASSTAIDASLKPLMTRYLADLESRLRQAGFAGRLLVISTAGGLMDARDIARAPILSINSGPAAAPLAARHFARKDLQADTVVVADTGGTSYDVALVRRGEIPMTRETWLGRRYVGHITGFPAVDVRSIGAGGGSIASVDDAGLLHVGPASAGADPGPVAYGKGGTSPTVTDAALSLGYLDPRFFLAGAMQLDAAAAEAALEQHVARPLGVTTHEAAAAVIALATEQMVQAIVAITVAQGVDPRDAVLVGGGGAAGLNAVPIARRLGIERVIVPDAGATMSAAGALILDLSTEFAAPLFLRTDAVDLSAAKSAFANLAERCDRFAGEIGADPKLVTIDYTAEARYAHQVWEIDVPMSGAMLDSANGVERFVQTFHERHWQVFAVRDDASPIHVIGIRARVSTPVHGTDSLLDSVEHKGQTAIGKAERELYFADHGVVLGTVVRLEELAPGVGRVQGPAIVEAPFTTVVLDPASSAERLPSGNLLISV
jgi:N-methylhydantoinase A